MKKKITLTLTEDEYEALVNATYSVQSEYIRKMHSFKTEEAEERNNDRIGIWGSIRSKLTGRNY